MERRNVNSNLYTYCKNKNIIFNDTWIQDREISNSYITKQDSPAEIQPIKKNLNQNGNKTENKEEDNIQKSQKDENEQKKQNIPSNYVPYYEKALESYQNLQKEYLLDVQNEWEFNSNTQNVLIHTRLDKEKGVTWSRGEGEIPAGAEKIKEALLKNELKPKYDPMFMEGQEIYNSEAFDISYQKFKAPFPLAPRDFVMSSMIKQNENGQIIISATSVELKDWPEKKGSTRAMLYLAGWVLTPIDDKNTNCVYLTCNDPKGSVPKKLVQLAAKNQALVVAGVRKLFI